MFKIPVVRVMLAAAAVWSGGGEAGASGGAAADAEGGGECVALLHGLARSAGSMSELERKIARAGFAVVNIDYPSRRRTVAALAADAVGRGMKECLARRAKRVHFVAHSLGGILVRHYMREKPAAPVGRVVMLAPPNQGSEMVDGLREVPGFAGFFGPAALSLGAGAGSVPRRLGAAAFELGIIAGDADYNPINGLWMEGPSDGTVTVASTTVAGMADHITLPATHSFIVYHDEAIEQAIHFLKTGRFMRPPAPAGG